MPKKSDGALKRVAGRAAKLAEVSPKLTLKMPLVTVTGVLVTEAQEEVAEY